MRQWAKKVSDGWWQLLLVTFASEVKEHQRNFKFRMFHGPPISPSQSRNKAYKSFNEKKTRNVYFSFFLFATIAFHTHRICISLYLLDSWPSTFCHFCEPLVMSIRQNGERKLKCQDKKWCARWCRLEMVASCGITECNRLILRPSGIDIIFSNGKKPQSATHIHM